MWYYLSLRVLMAHIKFSRSKPSHCYLANGAIAPLSHTGQNAIRYQSSRTHGADTIK